MCICERVKHVHMHVSVLADIYVSRFYFTVKLQKKKETNKQ